MNQVLGENERLLEQAIDKDIVQTVVNLSENASDEIVHECQKCLELETELVKKKDFVDKETYDKLWSKTLYSCFSGSQPSGNTKNDRILQPPRSAVVRISRNKDNLILSVLTITGNPTGMVFTPMDILEPPYRLSNFLSSNSEERPSCKDNGFWRLSDWKMLYFLKAFITAKVLRIPTNPNMKDTNQVKIYLLAYGSLWGNELSERVSGKNSGHRANNILLQHLCSPTDRSGLGFAVSTNVLMSYLNVGCTCTEVIAPIPEAVLHRNMLVSTAFHLPQLQLIKIAPNTKYTSPTTHKKLNSHSFS
ncbi:hypothetical protein Tco_1282901 [Tanacetum coccineum]|uniref:Uncharacterized protein n=1 Tax=Tanacetum coccineum TaxID=301880 RepID=A0ABQ4WHH6_9ASTR